MGNMAVGTMSQVVQSGRAELLAVRKRIGNKANLPTHVSRAAWDAALLASAIDDSDRDVFERLFTLYDKRGTGEVHVKDFLSGLAAIVDAALDERLLIALELVDDKGTGYLAQPEVLAAFVSMNRTCTYFGDEAMPFDQLEELVESTFETFEGQLVDGKLRYKDHCSDFAAHPIIEIFVSRQANAAH
ncbi:hypothetical protein M885DRAFT_587362 [Pelagophyceae sp. CCMP2097]|nr:hypothetical protein M885DRAFT_587362 [Pelagophyceae sp. CCMP2097]